MSMQFANPDKTESRPIRGKNRSGRKDDLSRVGDRGACRQ